MSQVRLKPTIRPVLALSLFVVAGAPTAFALSVGPAVVVPVQTDVTAKIQELRDQLDDASPELITELSKSKDQAACAALVEVYPKMNSLGARLRLVRAYPQFSGVVGCEKDAMQMLLDVASTDPVRELRMAAVEGIARAGAIGREYLGILVESKADDEVRVEAMRQHAESFGKQDAEFYRRLWKSAFEPEDKKKLSKEEEERAAKLGKPHKAIGALAFEALAEELTPEELSAHADDEHRELRASAQREIYRRDLEGASSVAERAFKNPREEADNRVAAATFLLGKQGEEFFEELRKAAEFPENPSQMRRELAELFANRAPAELKEEVAKDLGRGKPTEKSFGLRALAGFEDSKGKIDKAILKLIEDKERGVRELAAAAAAERKLDAAAPVIEESLLGAEDALEAVVYLQALNKLNGNQAEWWERVLQYSSDEREPLRNAAIRALVERNGDNVLEVLEKAFQHEQWSTRLIALNALEERRDKQGVGWMVAALDKETGRMSHEVADALFRLTGEKFRRNASAWARWWADNQDTFEPISKADAQGLLEEIEASRLEDTTRAAEFFGLKIDSHRVTFVIDVSGSMEEKMSSAYGDGTGIQRIQAARLELAKVLDGLDPEALFSVQAFSDKARPLTKELRRASEENIEESKKFLNKLNASGGTNLYGALLDAFEAPEMDTIVLLSDGEPSVGGLIEPDAIRRKVAEWNRERGVEIHTVAVGIDLDILRWLAEDSGGQHIFLK